MQMGRYISLLSLPKEVPGFVVNRYCGSGLEAIHLAFSKVQSGYADCIIAGGTESMSMVPFLGYKTSPNYNLSKTSPDYYLNMGLTAEKLAKKYNITREESDQFSFNSHKKAIEAIKKGRFRDEIVPIEVEETKIINNTRIKQKNSFNTDEGPREDTTLEALSRLNPVFKFGGQVTAGNSSQMSDGAAFVVVVSERFMKKIKSKPIARLASYVATGVEPNIMGIGPAKAIPKALKKAGLKIKDIEQIELNEAFSAQALAVIKNLNLNQEMVNVNGGAIALGHPLGMTGAKLSISLINEMKRRKQKYGIVTACVGGGQGVCGVFENLTL
jgi:acetyl-CoA acyltransferase